MPALLPWAAVLLLLTLRRNRTRTAWWVFAPLVAVMGAGQGLLGLLGFIPSELVDMVLQVTEALSFGFVALWLLTSFVARRSRFLTFLASIGVLAGISGATLLLRQDWQDDRGQGAAALIIAGLSVVALSVALHLAGRICRRSYRPLRLTTWALVLSQLTWGLVVTPFLVFALLEGAAAASSDFWSEFISITMAVSLITFLPLLSVLVLAYANSFYHERLKHLLQFADQALDAPPMVPVPEPAPMPLPEAPPGLRPAP